MRDQGIRQVCAVGQDQHNCDAEAEVLVERLHVRDPAHVAFQVVVERRQQQCDRRQDQQTREQPRTLAYEGQPFPAPGARHNRDAQS
jgi:ribosomal protein S12